MPSTSPRWDLLIPLFERPDMSQADFVRRHNLNIHSFRAQLYRYRAQASKPVVTVAPASPL